MKGEKSKGEKSKYIYITELDTINTILASLSIGISSFFITMIVPYYILSDMWTFVNAWYIASWYSIEYSKKLIEFKFSFLSFETRGHAIDTSVKTRGAVETKIVESHETSITRYLGNEYRSITRRIEEKKNIYICISSKLTLYDHLESE